MEFKHLRSLKSMVTAHNSHKNWEPVELRFPRMYADGKWSCTLVFGKFAYNTDISDFFLFLYGNSCRFYMGTINEHIAIHIQ